MEQTTSANAAQAKPALTPAQQTHRNAAVTAMILGITSLVLFFLPVLNVASLIVAIVGLSKAKKNRAFAASNAIKEDSMNTAGYVCSICGIVFSGLSILFWILAILAFFTVAVVAVGSAPHVVPQITDFIEQFASAASGAML